MPRLLAILAVSFFVILMAACGGSSGSLPESNSAAGEQDSLPLMQPGSLPAVGDLPAPAHEASIAGPGWYEINPRHTTVRVGGQPSMPNQIVLAAAGQEAYALYGVRGFDGDMFPTSVRLTMTAVTGDYYVGFSDYISGSWRFSDRFVGSATIEIPELDEYTSPTAYTSPDLRHYFVIVIPDGGGMTVTGVELGVHGGTLGPNPPQNPHVIAGEASVVLKWRHSQDYLDPDFTGYFVERAPLLYGDFAPLGPPEPNPDDFLLDDTGILDEQYRYRVATVDSAGNLSLWRQFQGGRMTGAATNPVPVLNLPPGPLYGPVEVAFDLSQSFDPENPGVPSPTIDSFAIDFIHGPPDMAGPAPVMNAVLQPGCYYFNAIVEVTADPRMGGTLQQLVVYPQWEPAPVVVRNSDAGVITFSKMSHLRMGRHPDTGRVTLFGYDQTIPAFAIWREDGGGDFELLTLPVYAESGGPPVAVAGEAIVYRDSIIVPVATQTDFLLAQVDNTGARWIPVDRRTDLTPLAAVTDGTNEIWVVYEQIDLGTRRLYIESLVNTGRYVVVPDIGNSIDAVAAAYNPATGMIDIVYGRFDGVIDHVEYVRWDPVNNLLDDETIPNIVADWAFWIDVEINPSTDRAAMVYFSLADSRNHYRELQPDGVTWSADEIIDNSDQNWQANLVFGGATNHPLVYFGLGAGPNQQGQLYEKDGAWAVRNTVGYSTDCAYDGGIAVVPGADDVVVVDLDGGGNTHVARLYEDGTDAVQPWAVFGGGVLPSMEGQGFELHGAAGSDGLHVIWRSWNNWLSRHYISPDGGVTWNDAGDLAGLPQSLDLTATADGQVYCSYVSGPNAELYWWDGAVFAWRNSIACFPMHRPFFSALPAGVNMHWTVYEDAVGNMNYASGNEIGGYLMNTVAFADGPVWAGVTQNVQQVFIPAAGVTHVGLAGGAAPDDGLVGTFFSGDVEIDVLYNPVALSEINFLATPVTWGRTMAVSGYVGPLPIGATEVFWATQHAFVEPVRYEYDLLGGLSSTELPYEGGIHDLSLLTHEYRRTVSADLAWGLTAVGLMSNLGGTDVIFEWSHFGDWENLDLPAGIEYMTMPELIVGMDGRWHIIYKDYLTDQIKSWSTL